MIQDESKAVVTYGLLKEAIKRLVKVSSDAILKTLNIRRDNSSDGVTIEETTDHDLVISATKNNTTNSLTFPITGTRTAATLEDNNQELHLKILRNGDSWIKFPGVQIPAIPVDDTGYLGELMTNRNFAIPSRTAKQTNGVTYVVAGFYNIASGITFNFTPSGQAFNSAVKITFVDLTIEGPEGSIPSIEWDTDTFVWATNEPDWSKCLGQKFLIIIIGRKCFVVARSGIEDITIEGDGNYQDAVITAMKPSNVGSAFQWLLTEKDENGNTFIKPIWHIGNGKFIDAFGCTVER